MFPDDIWQTIINMIFTNFDRIDESIAAGRYGMAAHYDSKNVALIELLETENTSFRMAKNATTRERAEALKKSRS